MEDVLEQLLKETQASKFGQIKESCQRAKEVLESQSSLLQCPPSELRKTCFKALQEALESKQFKLVILAIAGFQKLLRDNQFYKGFEENDESNWLPCQLMTAIKSLPLHSEDVQLELLKVILGMSCVPNITLSGHIVVQLIGICGVAYGRGSLAMKSAAQSAAVQAIVALINQIVCDTTEQDSTLYIKRNKLETIHEPEIYEFIAPAFDELVPVINFISEKLTQANKHKECKMIVEIPALFLLECTNSLLKGLSSSETSAKIFPCSRHLFKEKCTCSSLPAFCSTLLVSSMWQRLCPALIALLGTPVSIGVSRGTGRNQGTSGRGSGTSSVPIQLFSSQEAKAIYSVACNLIVAMGTVGEMRPVLESLFHRMLLYPPPSCRHDALKIVGELMRSPSRLVQLAGPILHSDPRNQFQCDLSLFRLIMDSLMECSNCNDSRIIITIIDSIFGLLLSMEILCEGNVLSPLQVKIINDSYSKLEDVDYSGPITYNSQTKLQKFEATQSISSDEDSSFSESLYHQSEDDEDVKSNIAEEGDKKNEGETFHWKELKVLNEKNIEVDDDLSNSSGGTEGPELLEVCSFEQQQLEEEEDLRLLRLSKSLGSTMIQSIMEEEQERECANALHFCNMLNSLLPLLLTIRSTIEVDEAVLEFSSKYCQEAFSLKSENNRCHVIINADGIYLATYAALSLNLKLIQSGHYCNTDASGVMTQEQFIENVFASGILVYLSSCWVGELYCQVKKDSFLQRAGYNPHSPYNCALVNLLTDLDGLGSIVHGSQMLSDYRRLTKAATNIPKSESGEAGQKIARRILTCCWESIISILETLLKNLEGESGVVAPIHFLILGDNIRKDETQKGQDLLILCLNTLQSIARLANVLGLQKRCGVVFNLLSSACLPGDEKNLLSTPKSKTFRSPSISKKPLRLHRAHILSFHVMMLSGLELGSHTPDCWNHLFRCCSYLSELERKFFSNIKSIPSFGRNSNGNQSSNRCDDSLLSSSDDRLFEERNCCNPSSLQVPPDISIDFLMKEYEEDISSSGFLSPHLSGKALCSLTLLIDKFFDSAAAQLNLAALVSFLTELCEISQAQLFARESSHTPKRSFLSWPRKVMSGINSQNTAQGLIEDILLLHRVGETMLKVVRSGRPLIHIMRAWSVAGPHFLEAACHKDGAVSKKAVSCIHDVVNSLLGCQVELPHFHFNEALFKPFENLLCLELCDIEVQDQIISSICEFVESCSSEIRSGWRPLFGALRCIRGAPLTSQPVDHRSLRGSEHEDVRHIRAVKDVFEAFLATDNVFVFANAALDCILCLVKHVKDPSEGEQVAETVVCWSELVGGDLCLDALRYIHRCAMILASMYMMPTPPIFHIAHRITLSSTSHLVDPNLPGLDEGYLQSLISEISLIQTESVAYFCLWPEEDNEGAKLLMETNHGSGLLQVWYSLLEGLAGSVVTCPRRYQAQVLDTLFSILKSLPNCPGFEFGMYCVNHLLLPLMQEWLRRSNVAESPTWGGAQCFKQYVGLISDLVVDYLNGTAKEGTLRTDKHCRLMLQQMLLTLVECISCPSEVIARLGCSCIRHIAISCGDQLPPELWEILVCSIHRASQVALYPLYQLMKLFSPDSPNFYGDDGHVKVAARRDCSGRDSDRLRQLSHQVFLLDAQCNQVTCMDDNTELEDRSFIFLLYPDYKTTSSKSCDEKPLDTPYRVPFRGLVVGLLASQIMLQVLGQLLVEGSPHVVPSLANVLLQGSNFSHHNTDEGKCIQEIKGELPGHLKWLTNNQIMILLDSLRLTYDAAVQFDKRPGLKFLIQKVAQSERAAHLYKQAGASWTLRMLTLFDLTLSRVKHGLNLDQVKEVLTTEVQRKNYLKRVSHENSLDKFEKPIKPTNLLDSDTQSYINLLCQTFNELCDTYLELVIRNTSKDSVENSLNDQPIFFLTISADEFSTSHRDNLEKWTKSLEDFNKDYMNGINTLVVSEGTTENEKIEEENIDISCSSSLPITMKLGAPNSSSVENDDALISNSPLSENEKKPFCFADLAQVYDSEDDENLSDNTKGGGDSGVDSAAGVDQSIYSIATEKDISVMMNKYRRKKNQHSMPSYHSDKRVNPFLESPHQRTFSSAEPVPPEIDVQRSSSLMKDSEAHLKVWTEMVVNVFDLISQLGDSELRPLLPLVFPTMRSLTAHAHDPHLRQVVAEMLNRVACLYGFSPAE